MKINTCKHTTSMMIGANRQVTRANNAHARPDGTDTMRAGFIPMKMGIQASIDSIRCLISYLFSMHRAPREDVICCGIATCLDPHLRGDEKSVIPKLVALSIPLLIFILLTGCDSNPTEVSDYIAEPVLTAYMETGQPAGEVWLERVWKDIETYYDLGQAGIPDAEIVMFPIDGNATHWDTLHYSHVDSGLYQPLATQYIIEGGVRYRIEVQQDAENVHLAAETTAPDTFSFTVGNDAITVNDTSIHFDHSDPLNPFFIHEGVAVPALDSDTFLPVFTRDDPIVNIRWGESAFSGGYLYTVIALTDTMSLEYLDPDADEDEIEPEDKGRAIAGILPGYQRALDLYWILFQWVGPHRVDVLAASEELYKYAFTSMTFGPPTTTSRPESNVEGGLGIFGITSTKTMYWYMKKVEN